MQRIVEIDECKLILDDCRNVQVEADLLLTDPPYGVELGAHAGAKEKRTWREGRARPKVGYDGYDDSEAELLEMVVPAVTTALSRCKNGIVFVADKHARKFPEWDSIGGVYLPAACGRKSWGFSNLALCLMYGAAPNRGAQPTILVSNEHAPINGHPCPKPIGWMVWAVKLGSRPGQTVYDPFMGGGSAAVAAMRTGRRFVGVEKNPKYFEIAVRSVREEKQRSALFAGQVEPAMLFTEA